MSAPNNQTPHTVARDLPLVFRLSGIFLVFVTWCQASGWILSWLGALHTQGYLLATPVALIVGIVFWRSTTPSAAKPLSLKKWRRRLKTTPSLIAWCIVCTLIGYGAIANAPTNYDAVTYRLPRLLYWLQEHRWHWIDGIEYRHNISGLGFEWLSAPFIVLTQSDRGLFLINFIPFLLLPGLFYTAACGLGIRKRVARWWMWVWPMTYGIALQAGSIGNDMIAAALALASLAFAAQAKQGRPWLCLFLSALAAAAMTSIKATTLPLGLPIGIYWTWVAWKNLGWYKTSTVVLTSLPIISVASFLPIAIACTAYTGVWSGNPDNRHKGHPEHPVAGIIGNSIEFASGLVQPPIFPLSGKVNASLNQFVSEQDWYRWTKANYPRLYPSLGGELPSEEGAGVGVAITALLCLSLFGYRFKKNAVPTIPPLIQHALIFGTAIGLLAYMAKVGVGGAARLTLPFVPLIILSFLILQKQLITKNSRINTLLQVFPAVCLMPALILNPNRPIIPVALICEHPDIPLAFKQRLTSVYTAYQGRATLLAPLQQQVPSNEIIGFAGNGDHSALGLFKPYGTRKVITLTPQTEKQLNWIVATAEGIECQMHMSHKQWEARQNFKKIHELKIVSKVSQGPELWYIYQRNEPKS